MAEGKGRKRRDYPLSWGARKEKMTMRKRVLCVFDGPRRLCKDDMMLATENEVRVALPRREGATTLHDQRWVTDLDILTLRRAQAFHDATEEERGPWVDETGEPVDIARLMAVPTLPVGTLG